MMSDFDFQRQVVDPSKLPAHLVFKWGTGALSEGFVAFPKKLIRKLSEFFPGESGMTEVALLLALADYAREKASRMPSIEFLSFVTGISQSDLEKAARSMITRELISGDLTAGHLNFSLAPIMRKLAADF